MKKSVIYLLALAALSMIIYASCRKNNENITQSDLSSAYSLPAHTMGVFYFDGNDGLIGYKAEDSTNVITNFDSTGFTFNSGDTVFTGDTFNIHHNMAYPTIAYLTFRGRAEYTDSKGDKIQIFGNFALDLDYVANGETPAPPKKAKIEHTCSSYSGLLDWIFACSCCKFVYKEGLIIGCDCVCGFMGGCVHTIKTTEEKGTNYGDGTFTGTVYNRIKEK